MSGEGERETKDSRDGPRAIVDPVEVCSLSEDGIEDRLEWIRREIAPRAIGRERLADGVAIEIRDAPGMSEKVDEWISLERDCCSPIAWHRRASALAGRIRVEVRGVDPDGAWLSDERLLNSSAALEIESGASAPGQRPMKIALLRRALQAGGLGALVSFVVCCVLPAAFVPMLGASAIAIPLTAFDDPRWIGLAAVVGAWMAWVWMGRRAARRRGSTNA